MEAPITTDELATYRQKAIEIRKYLQTLAERKIFKSIPHLVFDHDLGGGYAGSWICEGTFWEHRGVSLSLDGYPHFSPGRVRVYTGEKKNMDAEFIDVADETGPWNARIRELFAKIVEAYQAIQVEIMELDVKAREVKQQARQDRRRADLARAAQIVTGQEST